MNYMKHKELGLLLAFVFCASFTGCTSVRSSVTTFHTMPQSGTGQSFAVIPSDRANESSLEFASYAQQVVNELTGRNYQMIPGNGTNADLVVIVGYGIDDGRTVVGSAPVYGQTGGGTTSYSGTIGGDVFSGTAYSQPQYGVVGSQHYTHVVYTRVLTMRILDGPDLVKGKMTTRFEGKVISQGKTGNLSQIVPVMIKALFKDFPSKSGTTRTVELPLPEK